MLFPAIHSLDQRQLVGYNLFKGPAIGVVLSAQGKNVRVVIKNRKEFNLKAAAVFLSSGQSGGNLEETTMLLRKKEEEIKSKSTEIDLVLIHELLLESGEEFVEFQKLIEVYYGEAEPDFSDIMALATALDQDSCYFKRKKDGYQVNSTEVVEAYFEQLRRREEKQQMEQEALACLSSTSKFTDEERTGALAQALHEIAIDYDKSPLWMKYQEIFQRAGLHDKGMVRHRAVEKGLFHQDYHFELQEMRLPKPFPDFMKDASEVELPPMQECEQDLTSLKCITVDGEKTEDRDDALSYDGEWFYVHISNVALSVNGRPEVEEEVEKRLSSVYLLDNYFPMFSPQWIRKLSLQEKKRRSVFTVKFRFNNGEPEFEVFPSRIRIHSNLTYSTFEKWKHERYHEYFKMASRIYSWRLEHGAVAYKRPFELDFTLGDVISIDKKYLLESQNVIAEFSILANYAFARFCSENKIPVYFRVQSARARKEAVVEQEPEDFYTYYRTKKSWGRTTFEMDETAHYSLGLSHYTQMTSPIRRCIDYVNQKQLWSWFQNQDALLPLEKLNSLRYEISGGLFHIFGLQDRRKKHFILRYMQQQIENSPGGYKTPVTLLEVFDSNALAYFDEFGEIFRLIYPKESWKSGQRGQFAVMEAEIYNLELSGEFSLDG
jgi:exoribonuclease-2